MLEILVSLLFGHDLKRRPCQIISCFCSLAACDTLCMCCAVFISLSLTWKIRTVNDNGNEKEMSV
jgi:hypothetical protein